MYYGHYDNNGRYIGFYKPEIHCKTKHIYNTEPIETENEDGKTTIAEPGTVIIDQEWDLSAIPQQRIKLTEEEWQEALTGDYKVIDGKHTYTPSPGPTPEETAKQKLIILDLKYQPQFDELSLALGKAILDDNQLLIDNLKTDYLDLKSDYKEEREEIINGD